MVFPKQTLVAVLCSLLWGSGAPPSHAQTHRAELYTMGPGDDLFTKFGHAALCVSIRGRSPALCFNYGTTDFSRPVGLTLDVLRGRAEFFVSVVEEGNMLNAFQRQDRTIYRQTLPLSDEQVLRLARRLDKDALPENRAYVYDHFLDNCSTKPRDLIDDVTGGSLSSMSGGGKNPTFRELVDERLGYSWLLVSMSDLFLGRRLDRETTLYEAMFLPRELREAVSQQLGSTPDIIYTRRAPLPPSNAQAARRLTGFLTTGLAVTVCLAIVWGSVRVSSVAGIVARLTLGGLGALLLFMVVASPEPEIRYNENLLVFLPTDLLFATGRRKWIRLYTWLRIGELGLVGALAAVGALLQPLWPFWFAASGLVAAIILRSTNRRLPDRAER